MRTQNTQEENKTEVRVFNFFYSTSKTLIHYTKRGYTLL